MADARVKWKREWEVENPILREGEFGVERDTNRIKIGNGKARWTNLGFAAGSTGAVSQSALPAGAVAVYATTDQAVADANPQYVWLVLDAVTSTPAPAADTTAPTSPTGLTATAGDGQVSLAWTASTDAVGVTGYRVYRGGTLIASPTTNSYVDTGRTNGTSYSYTVSARDAAGNESSQTAAVTATPAAPGQAAGTVIAADTFNRADADDLGITSTGSKTWTKQFGFSAAIAGNQARLVGANGTSNTVATIDAGIADIDAQVTLASFGIMAGYPGLVARYAAPNSFLFAGVGEFANQGNVPGYGISLGSDMSIALGFYAATPQVGDVIRLVAKGTNYKLYVNGTLHIDVTSATPSTTATAVGLHGRRADFDIKFDDFTVKTA